MATDPKETTRSAPQETTCPAPQGTACSAPQVPQDTTSSAPQETTSSTPKETASSAPKETTSSAPQETTEKTAKSSVPSKSVTDIIVQDHKEVKAMYDEYKKAVTVEEKVNIRNQLVKALVKHDECEQMFAYPLLKNKIDKDESKEYFNKCLADHQEMRTLLHHVRYLDIKEDTNIDVEMDKAMQVVSHHMDLEEKEVLPMMSENLSQEELTKAGHDFEQHKPKALTRPHPDAPSAGLSASLANVIIRPFDMARDFIQSENKD